MAFYVVSFSNGQHNQVSQNVNSVSIAVLTRWSIISGLTKHIHTLAVIVVNLRAFSAFNSEPFETTPVRECNA